jgi:hypothetical protein
MRTRALLRLPIRTAVVLAVAATMATPAYAAPRSVPTNIDVSAQHNDEAENAIATNPTNPNNLVAMSTRTEAASGLFEGVTFDGGASWTRQVIGTGSPLGHICCDEQLAWDHFGNLWMTYLLNVGPDTMVAVSTDGGLTFTLVAKIPPITPKGSKSPSGAQPKRLRFQGNHFADQPSISVGANSVWVSYTSFPSSVIEASGARVNGLGRFGTFSHPQPVPTSNGRGDYGDTAVGPHGQVVVIYQDQTSGQGGSRIYTAIDPDGLGPAGFSDPQLFARSRVGGFDYIPAQPDRSVDAEANLAWDRSGGPQTGRLYAIWTQEVKNESNNMDIMFQYSDNAGASWSPPVRLNDDRTTNSQFNPSIALDQSNGNVAMSWYDCRVDLGTGGPGDTDGIPNDDAQIWATFSTDGGASLAPNFQVSRGASNAADTGTSFDYGDYTHAAFQSGAFYPTWSDNSNTTGTNPDGTLHHLDLYTARIAIS